ncbi:sensor histidine kinase [Bdellovibrio bacteriovorus]|uniref:sensor histidine kinase n=1 Tax=Bdellovibrio bacteriovorus TaxID=959 RepID=UPI003D000808
METVAFEHENRFKTIIESLPTGIVMVNKSGFVVLCNGEMEKMFGYSPGELKGSPIERLVPMGARQHHPQHREGFMQSPTKRQMGAGRDLSGLCKDGKEIPVEIGLNHIVIDNNSYAIASIVDITERKIIETRLKHAYDELQQKNQEMEQFVYTVSHDLKSPLVTSSSFIEFIKEDIKSGNMEDVHDSIDRLEKAHKRMQELINDLLQLSRAGRMELNLSDVSMNDIINEILENFSDRLKDRNIEVQIPTDLPKVIGDRRRLYQVLENLVTNALKYGTSSPHPQIQILTKDAPTEMLVGVKDNGPGIAPAYHRKIFGLFQRLDNSQEGTGVGLAIVQRIMQLHGGRTWVESRENEGATFWLAFPKFFTEQGAFDAAKL